MARLANPTYDEVFKYLMADERVCRAIIGSLLGKKIRKIKQRKNDVLSVVHSDLRLMRLDFNAEVENEDGSLVEVCIELQRAHEADEVMRFRKYLASQYSDDQNVDPEGRPLHIVTIYILGHNISNNCKDAVIRVNHVMCNHDGVSITPKESIEFINALTNDMIVVQIPRIVTRKDTLLDKILNVFKQAPRHVNAKTFDFKEDPDENDADMVNIIRVLERAAGDAQLIKRMDMEDEIVRILENAKSSEELADRAVKKAEDAMRERDEARECLAEAQQCARMAEEEAQKAQRDVQEAEAKLKEAERKSSEMERQMIANSAKIEQLMALLKDKGVL